MRDHDGKREGFRGLSLRQPEWWVVAAAVGAWVWMAAMAHPAAAPDGHAAHAGHAPAGAVADVGNGVIWTGVMVAAMMLPLTLPSVRHVAASTRGWRRHRAAAGFLAAYLAVWMLAMWAIAGAWSAAASIAGWTLAAGIAVAAAVVWEVAPAKRHLLHRCRRTQPIASGGWRADGDCIRFGSAAGAECVASCWALMALCVAFGHSLGVMAALFGVQLAGRYVRQPSPVLAAAAVLVVCLASIAARMAGWSLA
jgi:predicted metal-binding membrane protein